MSRGMFIDRDGVLNELAFNPNVGEYESPHSPDDLTLFPWAIPTLLSLQEAGWKLFLISNQPSYAKGKVSLEILQAIVQKFEKLMIQNGVNFSDYFYCLHHPDSIVEGYGRCSCRKPSPHFIQKALMDHQLTPSRCWIIGDQDTDMECGRGAGINTALVINERSAHKRLRGEALVRAHNLQEAVSEIYRFIEDRPRLNRSSDSQREERI